MITIYFQAKWYPDLMKQWEREGRVGGKGKNGVFCNKVIKYFSLIFLHFLFI